MRLRTAALWVLCALCAHPVPSLGKPTDPGQSTIWDQMMEAQALRDLHEGYALMERHEYDGAVRSFAKAVVSNPTDPMGHLMLGSAYYWQGEVPQAEAEFREGLRLDPNNAQGHLLMGIVHAWRGEPEKAYEEFNIGARLDPRRADLQMDLGSIEETLGRYPEALEHFRRAVALDGEHPLYHYQLGMLYRRMGRDADAADSLRLALKKYPEFEDAALELGAALERMNQNDDALDHFRKAVKLKARDSVARYRLGRSYLRRGDVKKARAVFGDAFHLTPEDNEGGLALSVAFGGAAARAGQGGGKPAPAKSDGKTPEGKPAAEPRAKAPETASSNDPLDMLARNLQRIPLDQDAKLEIDMAFMQRPTLERRKASETPSNLKQALEQAGKTPRAAATGVKREFKFKATSPEDQHAQVQKVLDELRQVLKQAPPDAEVRMGMRLNYTAKTQRPKVSPEGSPGAGGADSRGRVSYQPRQVGNDMGLWVMGTGWMALVEETLPEPGEEPNIPEDPDWWVSTGLGYAALGLAKPALAAFERAIGLDKGHELAWLGRAVALVESGREAEAQLALERVLEIQPKNKAARDGLKWLRQEPPQAKKGKKG